MTESRDLLTKQLNKLTAVMKWAFKSEAAPRIRAMIDLARSEPDIPILPAQMDQDLWLLNCVNGTIDLRTGDLRGHRREDLITKLAPVEYHPDATCPLWDRFLDRIMDGNTDLIEYLQRAVGYSLTGNVAEHVLFFFYGTGANGKTTFLGTILHMLGDYAIQAISELLMVRNNEQHPTERADLFGKRFIATIEAENGKRLAEALLKQLTGGDKIRARRMREDFWQFDPTHKIFLAANHKPIVRGTDEAIWRRIKLVPFTVTIPPEERDKNLSEKLKSELTGILAWSLRGCLAWQKHGLGEPDEVRMATTEYRSEMDVVAAFLIECCIVGLEYRSSANNLFARYKKWCEETGERFTMTQRAFGSQLTDRGFEKYHNNGTWYRGLATTRMTE